MFNRIKTSLLNPSAIGQFIKDKVGYVFLYILFLSLCVSLPSIIKTSLADEMDVSVKESIIEYLYVNKIDGEIKNGALTALSLEPQKVITNIYVGVNSSEVNKQGIIFLFQDLVLEIHYSTFFIASYSYSELGLNDLSLKMVYQTDKVKLGAAFDKIYFDYQPAIVAFSIVYTFIFNVVSGLIVILLLTLFYQFVQPKLHFKHRFVLATYSSFIYYLMLLFSVLFQFSSLRIIGLLLAVIFMNKAFKRLVLVMVIAQKEKKDE